jgi:predicted nucleic acid-binding protein
MRYNLEKTSRLYLDVCCLNRPYDDQTQFRIHLESEAILFIFTRFEAGDWFWIGSETMMLEIARNPDNLRRQRVERMMDYTHSMVEVNVPIIERAEQLKSRGIPLFDALHLACAEAGAADYFLTTDDRLLRQSRRLSNDLKVTVDNPLQWL